jgi:hypothetical protein
MRQVASPFTETEHHHPQVEVTEPLAVVAWLSARHHP